MNTFLLSLSLTTGALVLAFVSALVVWFLCYVFPVSLRKFWVVIVPLVLAFCLYWWPVWFNNEPASEYHTWMFAFLFPWFIAGVVPSALIVLILETRRRST